jgi:shikimate dehydrogenase
MNIDGTTRLAGILGWPVTHSRSPRLHNFWLTQYSINGAFVPLPVRPEHFTAAVRALVQLGFAGASVTVPHKEAAFALCDRWEESAQRARAVNLLVFASGGEIVGANTDGFGFIENLRASAPGFAPERGPAVVLGAGGGARAVVRALVEAGVPEIRLANRTQERAERLAAALGGPIRIVGWNQAAAALGDAVLLVNATSLGMKGQPPLLLDLERLPVASVVNDIVYVPLETELLRRARRRGNRVVDGLGMLIHQARPAFKAWFGHDPEVSEALRRHLAGDLMVESGASEPARAR